MKKIFFFILLIVLSSFAYSDCSFTPISKFSMRSNANDDYGLYTLTESGTPAFSGGEAGTYLGNNHYFNFSRSHVLENMTAFSFCVKLNTSVGNALKVWYSERNVAESGMLLASNNPQNMYSDDNTGGASQLLITGSQTYPLNEFFSYCLVCGGGSCESFVRGTSNGADASVAFIPPSGSCSMINRNACTNNDYWFPGSIKDIMITDFKMNSSQIAEYNNTGCPVSSMTPTPTLTLYWDFQNGTKINSSGFQYNFTYNGTVAYTYPIASCSNYYNGVLNFSETNINLSINNLNSLNFTITTGQFNYSKNCSVINATDSKNGVFVYVDTIRPYINIYSPVNNSNITQYQTKVFATNITDINLFSVCHELQLINDSSIVYSYCYTNLTGTTYMLVNYSKLFDIVGTYKYTVNSTDAHTGKLIDKEVKQIGNMLEFQNIFFYCNDTKSIKYDKKFDKVEVEITFNKKADKQYCYYETPNNWQFINDNYPNHFIDYNNLVWIDELNTNAISKKVNEHKIEFEYSGDKIDYVKTKSFGIMNFETQSIFLTVRAVSTGGLTEEEHNLFIQFGNVIITYLPYLELIYGVFSMIGFIFLNVIMMFVIYFFYKNLHRFLILLNISPLINIILEWFKTDNITIMNLSSNDLSVLMILNLFLLIFIFIILGVFYLVLPQEIKKKMVKTDFYGEINKYQ